MTSDRSRHPEADTMAAFIEGTLAPPEVAAVAQHLGACEDCRTVVSETARFEREESREARPSRTRRWLLTAAAIGGAVALSIPLAQRIAGPAPIELLAAAAPPDHRRIVPRVSVFPYARLKPAQRAGTQTTDPADLKFHGEAGTVLEQTAGDTKPSSRHAAGLAYLVTNQPLESIAALEQAANGSRDAAIWNDLAAARYVAATKAGRASQLPMALAAATEAVRLAPRSQEAHFNLALILEEMGVPDKARAAWEKYLTLDASSGWASEARARLRRLEEPAASLDFGEELKRAQANPNAIPALARAFPHESRTWSEAFLVDWANLVVKGDAVQARERLTFVGRLAAALAATNGEHLPADAVAAIERADGASRVALANAIVLYREARLDYQKRRVTVAQAKFVRAERVFREHGSAMAERAAYFAAATLPDRGLEREALRALQLRIGTRYRGLAAQVHWELAICASIAGDWGALLRESEASAAMFTRLNERTNAAAMEGLGAYALERIGATDLAWSRRIRAFGKLTAEGEPRRLRSGLLHAAALALESNDRAAAAEAVLDLMIPDVAGDEKSAVFLSDTLTDRARLASRRDDLATARRVLGDSRAAASRITDDAFRRNAVVYADLSGAVLQRRDDPRASLAALDRAIRSFTERKADALLAEAYLQRARAYRSAGDDAAADDDYASAFEHVARQRRSLRDADVPLQFVNTATYILEERVDLQLSRGDMAGALAESERGHALLRQDASRAAAPPAPIPNGVAVLKYVLLPKKVVIFCATSGGVVARTVDVERSEVTARITAFNERLRGGVPARELQADGAALYRMLIAPVRADLVGKDEIVLIPDRQLHTVPFAALYDDTRREYLVEQFPTRHAVSLSGAARVDSGAMSPAVVFADPQRPLEPPLSSSREEAERIAAMHGATLVTGAEATSASFAAAVRDRALVHYAGHADSNVSEAYGALLLAPHGQDRGVFGSGDIARLELAGRPLVVLAGCGTARGEAVHIGGMSSIARAFLDAGARAVVGTLWEIDDDVAADLFLGLHERLRGGAAPARALREVQLAMLHGADAHLAHPAAWSPVEVISNG